MNSPASFPCPRCRAPLPSADAECPACLLSMGADADATHLLSAEKLPERRLQPGETFGGYRIEHELGRGGMGAVYAATEMATGRRIAVKVLSQRLADAESRTRFLREGRVAASINHANSVYIFGTEEIEGRSVIAMELIGGGTLQQRVAEKGPLPVSEAVDAILDIIAGLEAAEAAGVLHRDIKPANCFIDTDGVVKVGDFGLSISTEGNRDLNVTQMGVFLGTPAFCSPEQLRGEPLDVRSDIYAVGVTLYFLLTGQTPFEGANVMQLMANALDKAPRDPAKLRPGLPKEIVNVLTRCLAKQAGNRPVTYAALKALLLPFRSTAPTPTSIGLRFVSWTADWLVEFALGYAFIMTAMNDDTLHVGFGHDSWLSVSSFIVVAALLIIPQGLWGATLGQALVRLRVVRTQQRGAPGLWRAALRYAILYLPTFVMLGGSTAGMSTGWKFATAYSIPLYRLLLFVTIRRRNGYAAVHDLLTGTRVVEKASLELTKSSVSMLEAAAQTRTEALGPYQVLSVLEERAEHTLHLAFDPRLMRRVWVKTGALEVEQPWRHITRYTRLRWLAQGEDKGRHWDAYEAPAGTALTAHTQKPCAWSQARHWLHDLAAELNAARLDGSLPLMLSLDRLWITAEGRLKLLDFPAPGSQPAPQVPADAFLNHAALAMLEGRISAPGEAAQRAAAAPVPLKARAWLEQLRHAPAAAAWQNLRPLLTLPGEVSRLKRTALLLIPSSLTLLFLGFGSVMGPMMEKTQKLYQKHPEAAEAAALFNQYESMKFLVHTMSGFLPEPKDDDAVFDLLKKDPDRAEHLFGVLIANRHGHWVRDEAKWRQKELFAILFQHREKLQIMVNAHPAPSAEDIAEAERVFAELVKGAKRITESQKQKAPQISVEDTLDIAFAPVVFFAVVSMLLTLMFRRGILPRAFHIDYVEASGHPARRARLLWRGVLGWLPACGLAVLLILMKWPVMPASLMVVGLAGLAALTLWLYSLLHPRRGLHDQLAGTWPVLV